MKLKRNVWRSDCRKKKSGAKDASQPQRRSGKRVSRRNKHSTKKKWRCFRKRCVNKRCGIRPTAGRLTTNTVY